MKSLKKHTEEEEEVVLDADSGDEIALEESEASTSALKNKLKALRTELAACHKEREDNLAGWQRAKADLVNFRRTVEEDRERDGARAKGRIMREILPALDSFEHAMGAESWASVEEEWRKGVERIADQLRKALAKEGLHAFGEQGDSFDPTRHESVSVTATDKDDQDDTIAQVLQKGYRIGEEVIRPAKVIVWQRRAP